jgi:chromate transporter
MPKLLELFLLFIKVNLLTTSGPASVGLLYKETVGTLMTYAQFVQAVSFSSILPGSDALQLAMFIGYTVLGVPGALVALLGSILPPTILIFGVVNILHRLRREAWVGRFVSGLMPAVTILMVLVAWKVFQNGGDGSIGLQTILIAAGSLAALLLDAPAPLVLLAAGLMGVFLG